MRSDGSIVKSIAMGNARPYRKRINSFYENLHTFCPINTRRRELETQMWTKGFKYSWRKMETAAHNRPRRRGVVCGIMFHWE